MESGFREETISLPWFGLGSTRNMLFLLANVGILWDYHGCDGTEFSGLET